MGDGLLSFLVPYRVLFYAMSEFVMPILVHLRSVKASMRGGRYALSFGLLVLCVCIYERGFGD